MRTVSEFAAARPAGGRAPGYWADLVFGRTLPAIFFGLFIVYQLLLVGLSVARLGQPGASVDDYLEVVNRALRLAFFTMLVVLYAVRLPARNSDRRPYVFAVSLIGTFCVLLTSFLPAVPRGAGALLVADILLTAGMAWAVWGLAYLRRSFSIIPEARALVTGGPYALSRNPLYLGEGVASLGVVLPVFSYWHALLLLVFVASQALRIHWEQKILLEAFGDEFAAYMKRVPVLLPWPGRR
jgi:protein-S-isoprenylcysteine O-methyltransferase Ste14